MAQRTDPKASALKKRLAEKILTEAERYVPAWIESLGEAGTIRPWKKGMPMPDQKTRIAAAKTGMDIVMKLFPDAGAEMGVEDLLKNLQMIDSSEEPPEEFPEPEPEDIDADPE